MNNTDTLKAIKACLERENERGAIADTLWMSPCQTLFDFIDAADERAAFEAAMRGERGWLTRHFDRNALGAYVDAVTQTSWKVWQLARGATGRPSDAQADYPRPTAEEIVQTFETARAGSDRAAGILRGVRAVMRLVPDLAAAWRTADGRQIARSPEETA